MDMTRLIRMILNPLLGRLINTVVNRGIDYAARRGRGGNETLTAEEQQQARDGRDMAGRARKIQRTTRRLF